ncbi:MAG: molybdopterin-binding protein [Bacillota bacterium]
MDKKAVEKAVGDVLAHDITEIKPGKSKGPAFKKGHIIKEEDIPRLLDLGKRHVYIWEKKPGYLHENEAAARLADLGQGEGMTRSKPSEGKINLYAARDGLLQVDKDRLFKLNSRDRLMMATRHNYTPVKEGDYLAGTRIIPLLIAEEELEEAEAEVGQGGLLEVTPYRAYKAVIITTGNEVYTGRITDKFTPVVEKKLEQYNIKTIHKELVTDDKAKIAEAITTALEKGADIVVCTGGMSVDPDDLTPAAIRQASDEVVTYGAPVLPGAMFMLAYTDEVPLIGLPGCVMFSKTTVFDLILPRIAIGQKLNSSDIAAYGHGGLCISCDTCVYPDCHFGKGV